MHARTDQSAVYTQLAWSSVKKSKANEIEVVRIQHLLQNFELDLQRGFSFQTLCIVAVQISNSVSC